MSPPDICKGVKETENGPMIIENRIKKREK